jgi:hypothetical protein
MLIMFSFNLRISRRCAQAAILFATTLLPAYGAIKDTYIAQNAAGAGNGSSCSSAFAYTFFNSTGNWGSGSSQIGPGTTVHLCGTISAQLTLLGDGSSGNPLTVLFETGAKLSIASGYSNGFIYGGASRSFIIIDGGANGVIESTNNGSSPTYPNQVDAGGVYFPICNHCEIKNLTVSNLFVKNTADGQGGGDAIDIHSGSNNLIHNNTIHDTQIGIIHNFGNDTSTQSGDSIYSNTIYHFNHAIAVGDASTNSTFDGLLVYGNNLYDPVNWDDLATNAFHHNGVFVFSNNAGNHYTNLRIYNNYIHGDFGQRETGHIFLDNEDNATSTYTGTLIFNNLLVDDSATNGPSNGLIITKDNLGGSTVGIYNNTMYFTTNVGSRCTMNQGAALTLKNNANYQCGDALYISGGTVSSSTDHNNYTSVTQINGNSTLSAWQTTCSCDSHSFTTALNINVSTYIPNMGSPLISAGVNLTSLGVVALDSDKGGVTRPSSTAWDVGAYQLGSSAGSTSNPPSALTIIAII